MDHGDENSNINNKNELTFSAYNQLMSVIFIHIIEGHQSYD
jgi:hypothetical protein